ncbi:Molybdate transporter 1 [Forsythia ovata]|uniref:Molybdate transporter 1 n=1 Tax=Forsythia ovata TaxID=205694 RepID=A0ABD1QB20_9LAMI
MNLIGYWFGATSCCHGAGGLARQYKFGGRSGGCVALLGIAKLVLGLVLGSSLVKILDQFPVGILGPATLISGHDIERRSTTAQTVLAQVNTQPYNMLRTQLVAHEKLCH